jgi:drug/metabolite transporter (DMT)-like permease
MSVSAEDWIKGITLSVMASLIGGASKLAIRKSWLLEAEEVDRAYLPSNEDNRPAAVEEEESAQDLGTALSDRRTTRIGYCLRGSGMIGMTFLNPLCGVLAMNYASPSITAPFSGLTLVWIVLFSKTLIGEQPSYTQIVAASLIVLGEVVVAIFGDHTNDDGITLHDLQESYRDLAFLLYLAGVTVWMCLMFYWMKYSSSMFRKRFAWGVAGGSITGVQNFLKDGLTVLKAEEGLPWYLPVMIIIAVGVAFGGLLLLSACMKRYDATYSSAMFVGAYVVSASIMSAVHYKTFANLNSVVNYILYPGGLLILMTGVWILVKETKGDDEDGEESPVSVSRHEETELSKLL